MEIKNLKKINKGNLIAVFDVKLNSMLTINEFKLVRSKDGKEFIALKSIKNSKGAYESIGKMSKELGERILGLVKEVL